MPAAICKTVRAPKSTLALPGRLAYHNRGVFSSVVGLPMDAAADGPDGGRARKLIDLKAIVRHPLQRALLALLGSPIERALSFAALNEVHARAGQLTAGTGGGFFHAVLEVLRVDYVLSAEDHDRIPTSGPLVIVANHPFGGLEGIILGDLMMALRPDVRVLGNFLLQQIGELRDCVIPVNPFGRRDATRTNARALREAIRWLRGGGALVTFPAGEVSHLKLRRRQLTDPPWSRHVAAMIRHSQATALPIFFPGRNSTLFQALGLLHPRLRTVLLARELMKKSTRTIEMHVGRPMPWRRLSGFEDDELLTRYLRFNTYFLRHCSVRRRRRPRRRARARRTAPAPEPVIAPLSAGVLEKEIASLPADRLLAESGDLGCYTTRAAETPAMMREIGRLREITFRQVGEGTGNAVDLDRFDAFYDHLFIWNRAGRELVGAYRLGPADVIVDRHGPKGLYTSTLFKFKPAFLARLRGGVELGRSFIRVEYQKKHSGLSLLWKGIGAYILRSPHYHILFGPVSISEDYQAVSRNLMVQFLRQNKLDAEYARYVRPRHRYRAGRAGALDRRALRSTVRNIEDVSLLISSIEKDGKGIPILLRQYLNLNATICCFNLDRDFSNVVDGLIIVDLTRTDQRLLKRFLGPEGAETFLDRRQATEGAEPALAAP